MAVLLCGLQMGERSKVATVKKETNSRRGIQSVEIGLRVLEAVAANREASSLSRIAESSKLSSSQAHRYLSSLMASGMVRQDGRAGLYDLDVGAIRLGLAALARLDTIAVAEDACRDLTRQTGRTCMLSVWSLHGPVVVRWFNGDPPVVTSLGIGSTLPLLSSATGRVFLAFGNESLCQDLLQKESRALKLASRWVEQQRAAVRKDMVATVEGDLIPGLRADSAPVFDLQGALCFSLTTIANAGLESPSHEASRVLLRSTCQQLTESFGGEWSAR